MRDPVKEIDDTIQKINSLKLDKEGLKPHSLFSLDIERQVQEYIKFMDALNDCRDVAEEEYENVMVKVKEVSELRNNLWSLMQHLQGIVAVDGSNISNSTETGMSQREMIIQLKDTMNRISSNFEKTIECIVQKIVKLAEDMKLFTVVLFGRTKAGKSTVREALTMGNGETIGKGGQSTTKENHEYNWKNLRIFDTPGILSERDTNKDNNNRGIGDEELKAKELLEKADITLFLFVSDNIEQAELTYLSDIASKSKNLLILLNVKSDISDFKKFKLRHKERELQPEMQSGHINRIQNDGLGGNPKRITILPIHAQAGFFSRARNNADVDNFYKKYDVSHDELYELSHFADIRAYLIDSILREGRAIRCRTIWNFFIENTRNLADENRQPLIDNKNTNNEITRSIEKAKKKVLTIISKFKSNCKSQVLTRAKQEVDTYNFAYDCIDIGRSKDSIGRCWKDLLEEKLKNLPRELLEEVIAEIQTVLSELQNKLRFDAKVASSYGGFDIGIDWNSWLKIGGGILSIGGGVLSFLALANIWNPGGWVISAVLGIGALLNWLGGLFKSKAKKVSELNEKLSENLENVCNNMSDQLIEYCEKGMKDETTGNYDGNGPFQLIIQKLDKALENQKKLDTICLGFLALNDKLQEKANEAERIMENNIRQLSKGKRLHPRTRHFDMPNDNQISFQNNPRKHTINKKAISITNNILTRFWNSFFGKK